jgi:hypothetical protein
VARFLGDPNSATFEELALAKFTEAYERDPEVRALAEAPPDQIGDWREIPLIEPWTLADTPAAEDLGTLAGETAFRRACLAGLAAPPILDLVGAGDLSSLGGPGSLRAAGEGARVDVTAARSWLAGRQRDGRPAVVVATDAAWERLLGALARQDLRFRLGFGSRAVLLAQGPSPAGTMPGADRLGLDSSAVFRELRWPGVASPCYTRAGRVEPLHWVGLVASAGRLAVLDLVGSPLRVATPVAAVDDGDGLRISAVG